MVELQASHDSLNGRIHNDDTYQFAGANADWCCQFRYRGPRRSSGVAQLWSLGHFVSARYYIGLSALLGAMLFVFSPNLRQLAAVGLCFWLFLICLAVSGLVGIAGGIRVAGQVVHTQSGYVYTAPPALLASPFTMPLVAVATFSILYFIVALGIVRFIERRQKVELGKLSTIVGIVLAALSPFFVWPFYIHIFYPHG
jgi:hypothetical protein